MSRIRLDKGDLRKFVATMGGDPKLPKVLEVIVRASMLWSTRDVIRNRLLGQYLKRDTGTGIRSIAASPRIEKRSQLRVVGAWGTHLGYMMAHERGFRGAVQVRAHTRRKFRRTKQSGEPLKQKKQVSGVAIKVRAHIRNVDIVARNFIRDTQRAAHGPTRRMVRKAMRIWMLKSRVPRLNELTGA